MSAQRSIALARKLLAGMAVFWVLWAGFSVWGSTLQDTLPPEQQAPLWILLTPALLFAALNGLGAWGLRAGAKGSWTLAVSAAMTSLMCLTLPVAVYTLWLLFSKPVRAEVLGGGHAR